MGQLGEKYKIKKLYDNTYSILDNGMEQVGVYLYLLVGEERALLIDSGYGGLDLPAIIRTITDKKVICACTHGHIDHALGAYHFEEAYLHTADFELYRQHSDPEMIRRCGYQGIGFKPPKKLNNNPDYHSLIENLAAKPRQELLPLDTIDAFDLGGRTVRWVRLPGHTQGSCVFWDEHYNTVFDSDAASMGVWLFLPESCHIAEYRENLITYKKFLEENKITRRFAGHSGRPGRVKGVQNLINCCGLILAGKRKGKFLHMSLGDVRLVFACRTLMFCNPEDIVSVKK